MIYFNNKKRLNIENIEYKLRKLGISQSDLAKKLSVSREIISQWLQNKKYPRPRHLLFLSKILNLSFTELVILEKSEDEPVIAFRKKRGHKIDEEYEKQAKFKGYILQKLVPYLPFDQFYLPSTLKHPENKYDYIQKIVKNIRCKISDIKDDVLEFNHLIKFYRKRQAVIIPVFWGEKSKHENALHIFLPKSKITYIFLNLDTKVFDFKFWIAHELGHILAPNLKEEESEDFADNFAGALLFPEYLASKGYIKLINLDNIGYKINYLKELAKKYIISPITIFLEINKYASNYNKPEIDLGAKDSIFRATTEFQKDFEKVSDILFETKSPSPYEFINRSRIEFKTPFFKTLKKYISNNDTSPAFIQRLLEIPYPDASSLYKELTK
jgi:transcriptional regulator with XRE-family HTH domain